MNLLQLESTSTTKCVTIIVIIILNDKPINLIIFGAFKGANTTKGTKKGCSALDCNSVSLKNYEDNTMI